jgi:4-amino-4-deoxy-L-arabinose transferase-like glycosyltransferase
VPSRSARLALLFLLGAALLSYVVDLGGSSIWDANEAYYVETPREMIESGNYVTPQFNYEPRTNKPVLSYWVVAGLYRVFGVSVGVERVAIAAAALVIIAAAWFLARAASPHALAPVLAAAGLAASPRFFMFARRILVDVLLTAFMTLILLFFALAERYPHRRRAFLLAMYVCVGLGVLTKGPVAAALPALVFAIYLVCYGELRRIRTMMIPTGLAIVLVIVAPWYVALYQESGWTHISTFILGENLDRYTSAIGQQGRGPLYYLPVLLTDALPWSLLLPVAIAVWIRERRERWKHPDFRIRTLLLLWTAVIVGFFSLSSTKQDLYIFPVVAAVAVLGGDVVARGAMNGLAWMSLRLTMAAVGALFVGIGAIVLYLFQWTGTAYTIKGTLVAGLVAAVGGAAALLFAWRRTDRAAIAVLATLVGLNWTLVISVLPSVEAYKPVAPLSQAINERVRDGDLIVHYNVALPSMVFYVGRRIDVAWSGEELVEMIRSGKPLFAVLPDDRYSELAVEIGGSACVIDRRPTLNFKLGDVLASRSPPAIVLLSTRCPSAR